MHILQVYVTSIYLACTELAEFQRFIQKWMKYKPKFKLDADAETMFQSLDVDGDGKITVEELARGISPALPESIPESSGALQPHQLAL